ncbi:MAG: flavin reductase family protein [Thermoplasmatota archaeon]
MELDARTADPKRLYGILSGAVAPRPIAWITTQDAAGLVNAAPFSWYNALSSDPPMVMTAIANHRDGRPKDTVRNLRHLGEYVVNVVTRPLLRAMVASSADYPPDVSEVDALGLATTPSRQVAPPRLAASPIHLECRVERMIPLGRPPGNVVVFGEVVHMAADDAVLDERGEVDPDKIPLMARLGGTWYSGSEGHLQVPRPRLDDPVR